MATFSRSAVAEWRGDVARGSGVTSAGTDAFSIPVTFPHLRGEEPGITTPEELLAASHASCFAIGLRSVLGQHGTAATRVQVTATITAAKDRGAIRILSSHLQAVVEGLAGVAPHELDDIARAAEEGCTISAVLRPTVRIEREVRAI